MANEHELNNLSNEERETHLNMVANNRGEWKVFSDDPVMIRKLDKMSTAIMVRDGGKYYTLKKSQVTLRKEVVLTPEQRKAISERAKKNLHGVNSDSSA
jgi:hypothetical protein